MPFLISQAQEVRPAKAEILPDERKRLTRFVSWKQNSELPLQLTYNYGDADVFTNPPTGWSGLRLIDAQSDYSLSNNGAGNDPIIRLTYEQISDTGETQVGGTETTVLEDGRVSRTLTYIQFSNVAYTPTAAGTAGSGGFLLNEVANDNGSVRTIRRTYVESGLLSQADETKNNGKLLIRTLTYAITTPPTPSGYTLISENRRGPDGYEILTYTFAKGDGQISQEDSVRNDGKLLLRTIRHLTAPGGSNPISTPGGYVSIGNSFQEADGYRIWTASFADGDGEISRDTSYRQSVDEGTSGLTFITVRHLTASSVSSNPVSIPGGFILTGVDRSDQDGYRVWTVSFARGDGIVDTSITARQDGLREVTIVSLGTKEVPDGVVIRDDEREADGYVVYTVTSIQAADGDADPTAASIEFERYVPFTYPGRAKAYNYTSASPAWENYDVFRSPPVTADVVGTITVTYQTSDEIGSVSNYWNPSEWAVIEADWTTLGEVPGHQISALPGYRSVSDTPLTFVASTIASDAAGTMLGNVVYGGTTATLVVYGGPDDPGGNTYTLDVTVEPAFTSITGTVYYRRTQVVATIPAQDALPV